MKSPSQRAPCRPAALSDPLAGYGLVKLEPRGKARSLADFDAARLLKRKKNPPA